MTLIPIQSHLHPRILQQARDLAARRDITLGQLIRDSLEQEIKRASQAKTRNCADEPLVARLQRLLARDMAEARNWVELHRAVARKGCQIAPAGGGLILLDLNGTRLCKTSELGFGYARLVKRFGAPMPGHPHRMAHLLNNTTEAAD